MRKLGGGRGMEGMGEEGSKEEATSVGCGLSKWRDKAKSKVRKKTVF